MPPRFPAPDYRQLGQPFDERLGSDWISNLPRYHEGELRGPAAAGRVYGQDEGRKPMPSYYQTVKAAMGEEPVGESLMRLAKEEPGLYSSIQKALNKVNEKHGSKDTMFDFLSSPSARNKSEEVDTESERDPQMELGQAHYNHIGARGDFAREKRPDQRTDQDWKDIQNYIETFGPGYGWEDESKMMNNYFMGGGGAAYPMEDHSSLSPSHINAREDMALGNVPDVPFKGTGRDDRIAMLHPFQKSVLKAMGGSGNINPQTGLQEFDDGGDWGSGDDGSSGAGDWGGSGGPGADAGGGPGADDGSGATGGGASETGNSTSSATGPGAADWNGGFDWAGGDGGPEGGGRGDSSRDAEETASAGRFGDKTGLTDAEKDMMDTKDTGKTGSGGKETDMGLQQNPMGLQSPKDTKDNKSFLDSVKGFLNFDPDRTDKRGPDPLGFREPSREGQKGMLGFVGGVGALGLANLGAAMKDMNLDYLGNQNYGKAYADLNEFERAEVDAQDKSMNERGFSDSSGTYNDTPRGSVARPAPTPPAPPGFLSAQRPAYWNFEGDPLQQRTGAATEALYGRPIFRSPEAQDYYRRLASESITPIAPPRDVDYTYLTDVLGRARPGNNSVQAFLDALRY